MIALTLALFLAQAEEAPAPPAAEEPAPAAAETGSEEAVAEAPKAVAAPPPKGADEASRALSKWATLPEHERSHVEADAIAKWREVAFNAVYPPDDVPFAEWAKWSEADQAKLVARRFVLALIAGNANDALHYAGLPFFLEDKRWSVPADFAGELGRRLKKKRVDLWVLFDVTFTTPADMEKKYGKPPARLASWPLRNNKTGVAVANLSGHGAVLLMRQVGATWQVIGLSD